MVIHAKSSVGTSRKLHNSWTGPWTIQEAISKVLFRIHTTGAWSRKPISIITSINRLQRYHVQVSADTTALDRLPLGQEYRPKDFKVQVKFLESSKDLPNPTREFEAHMHPPPDDFEDTPAAGEDPPRPPSPGIPQPRISPRKIRRNWTRARGKLSPKQSISPNSDHEMGSNNKEDPRSPSTFPQNPLWTPRTKKEG